MRAGASRRHVLTVCISNFRLVGDTHPLKDRVFRWAPVGLSGGDLGPVGSNGLPFIGRARGALLLWIARVASQFVVIRGLQCRQAPGQSPAHQGISGRVQPGARRSFDRRLRRFSLLFGSGDPAGTRGQRPLCGVLAAHTCSRRGGTPAATNQITTGSPRAMQACYNCRAARLPSQLPTNLGRFDQDFVKFHRDIERQGGGAQTDRGRCNSCGGE